MESRLGDYSAMMQLGGVIPTQNQYLFGIHLVLIAAARLASTALDVPINHFKVTFEPREKAATTHRGAKPR